MWEGVIWGVYWLCWIETGQMWISILWSLCGLVNWNLLYHCAVQRVDIVKNISHCHNGIRLYYGYSSWWIYCVMNIPDQCRNHAFTMTWHFCHQCFLSEQYTVFTYTSIQTQRVATKSSQPAPELQFSRHNTQNNGPDVNSSDSQCFLLCLFSSSLTFLITTVNTFILT
jgi:hypothetical protein